MSDLLLTPPKEPGSVATGRPPHKRYRIIRGKFEDIVRSRDELLLPNAMAAKRVGLRGAKEFVEAYDLLKKHGAEIVVSNNWEGVEAVVYARFPRYRNDPRFHAIQDEFGDPRPRLGLGNIVPPKPQAPTQGDSPQEPHPSTGTPPTPETPRRSPWGGKNHRAPAFPGA